MKFSQFSQFLEKIESISSRNEMTISLSEFFSELKGDETKYVMYLMQGRLIPKYVNLEFNFSRKLIFKALERLTSEKEIKTLYSKFGDVGLTSEAVMKTSKEDKDENLEITAVYEFSREIALASGKGSQEAKINGYLTLIKKLDPVSVRYLTRTITGELRLGISDKTVLDALSWFVRGDKSLRADLDSAFGAKADIGELAFLVINNKKEIEEKLRHIKLEPGIPVASKLVERESDVEKIFERMPTPFMQPKLDGLRGQLHYSKKGFKVLPEKTLAVFSRNMEDMTDQFPELTLSLTKLGVDSIILDSEIIGVTSDKKYLTYQETMQRKRKYDIGVFSESIPVNAMVFDILYLNGEDLTKTPIEERLAKLNDLIKDKDSALKLLETKQAKDVPELLEYFEEKINAGLEGIITKEMNSSYEPGSRNFKWIKLKANTRSDFVDTIDVVVMGYYIGRGQRAKFGVGALLTGVYDPKTDKYYSVGKVGTGITDELFETIKKDLVKCKVEEMPLNYEVEKSLTPDYWTDPKIIIEIDADEITRSPNHTAARGVKTDLYKDDYERGLSIRFPRLKIWNRTDKDLPNTVSELVRLYVLRKQKGLDK